MKWYAVSSPRTCEMAGPLSELAVDSLLASCREAVTRSLWRESVTCADHGVRSPRGLVGSRFGALLGCQKREFDCKAFCELSAVFAFPALEY